MGVQLPDVELTTLEPPAEAFLVGIDLRPRDGHSLLAAVSRPLAMIPMVHEQSGQVPPERLLRAEDHGRDFRMGLFRRPLRRPCQPRVQIGPDKDVGIVRHGIDDPHGLAVCHRLPLLSVQFNHGFPPPRSYRMRRDGKGGG
jgi:hypothetical protein